MSRYGDTVEITLVANNWKSTGVIGRWLILADIAGTVSYEIRKGGRSIGKGAGLKAGFGFGPIPEGFDELLLMSATGQTARVVISEEAIQYNRVTGTITTVSAALTVEHGSSTAIDATGVTFTPPAGTTSVQITAAEGNTDTIWPSGTVGDGTPIYAGASITWPIASAFTIKASSGTQTAYVTYFKD